MSGKKLTKLAFIALMGCTSFAQAAAFFLIEQSVSTMGNAHAGAAASAEDASTIWFNPAGLTRVCGTQLVAGGNIIIPKAKFHNDDSLLAPGVPLTGGNGHNAGEAAFVGATYLSHQINNCLTVGLGISSPFGLVTDYGHEWVGRYYAIRSAMLTININPSIAYKINECWSVGVGVSAMYLHAKLTNAINFGSFGPDGIARVKGNSWGWGANAGILWEPYCGTRFGLSYRSEVKHRPEGSAKFSDIPEFLDPLFPDTRAKAQVTLPSITSFSAYHELNNCWAVLADITWFKWKVIKDLRFSFNASPPLEDSITTLRWENTFRYSLGATYRPNCCWAFKVGTAYDKSPVKNKELFTPRIPDADRIWATLGAHYQWNACLGIDVAYAHIFARTARVDKTGIDPFPPQGALRGHSKAYTDIISGQIVYNF